MAWIPYDKNLPKKVEVMRIAASTGMSRREVVAVLMEFWAWADDETQDGFLPGIRIADLSHICHTLVTEVSRPGHVSVTEFFSAVASVGWILETGDGIDIVNFEYYMGESAKKRLSAARRQRKSRNNRAGRVGKKPRQKRQKVTPKCDESVTTEQNSTLHNTSPLTPSGGVGGRAPEKPDPDADLPPFDAGRRPVRQVCDAPHLEPEARRVAAHYVAAVGRPAFAKGGAGLAAVMDLLDRGVRAEVLLRAADAYGLFAKINNQPPMGVLAFFGEGGDWKDYCKGPPKPRPLEPFVAPKLPDPTPEELAKAERMRAARLGKAGANGATGTPVGAHPAKPPPGGVSVAGLPCV